jgi:cytidylate kinase
MNDSYLFNNVTISGLPGCGSTTLKDNVIVALESEGWVGFSGGEHMRAYAIEKGYFKLDEKGNLHHDATVYSDDFDREVDFGMRERVEKGNKQILEAWLSGFMAQGVPKVLKVLMLCSDESVRVDRMMNRDNVTADDAIQNMNERLTKNSEKWKRLYADQWKEWVVGTGLAAENEPIDFWNPRLYDLCIDTYKFNKEQSLQLVLNALKGQK